MEVMQQICNSTVDFVKCTFKKKNILTFVTLLKATVGLSWQIMQIIIIRTDMLNLSLISRISALGKYKN